MMEKWSSRLSLFWVLQISGWAIYGILYYLLYYSNKDMAMVDYIGFSVTYIVAIAVTLVMRKIYQRFDDDKRSIQKVALTVFASVVVFAIVWLYVDRLISYPIYGIERFQKAMDKLTLRANLSQVYWNAFILFTWSSLYFLIKFWREMAIQQERVEKAELLAHSAQLQMLRYQLNPHFLFNSLNSIRALILEDQGKARDMITELSELLRYSLIGKNNGDVALSEELKALEHYFAIEKKRFEDSLQVQFEIDPQAEDFPIPSFLIHPLVENAVKYGMKTSPMPLRIKIEAQVKDRTLELTVRNSGSWLAPDGESRNKPAGTGTGLKNVADRLENRFPGRHKLSTFEDEECVVVHITLTRSPGESP